MTAFDRVKFLCEKRKVSMVELEERLGFSRNSMYSWKKNNPSADKLTAVADYFNVPTDYILGRMELSEWELMDRLYKEEIRKGAQDADALDQVTGSEFILSPKTERSIKNDLERLIADLDSLAYSKDVSEMSEQTKQLLKISLEQAAQIARLDELKNQGGD